MVVGTILELYLIHHYESFTQLIPIICIGLILILVVVLRFKKSLFLNKLFKGVLIITALSSIYGVYLHLNGNYEFEIEMTPTANKADLLIESLSGGMPALAPMSMLVLALIGYSYLILINKQQ